MGLACLEPLKFPTGTVIEFLTLLYLMHHDDLMEMLPADGRRIAAPA